MTRGCKPATIFGAVFFAAVVLLPLAGCGRQGLKKIEGTVTYQGQPIRKGLITFLPPNGDGPTAAAPIVDGKYSVPVALGRKQVKIEGFKVVGRRPASPRHPDGQMVDDERQMLPERYNVRSELFREITADKSIYDFHLEEPERAAP